MEQDVIQDDDDIENNMPADNESVGLDHLAIENMSDSTLELGGRDSSDGEGAESEGSMPKLQGTYGWGLRFWWWSVFPPGW